MGAEGRDRWVGIWHSTQTTIHLICPLSSTARGDGLAVDHEEVGGVHASGGLREELTWDLGEGISAEIKT